MRGWLSKSGTQSSSLDLLFKDVEGTECREELVGVLSKVAKFSTLSTERTEKAVGPVSHADSSRTSRPASHGWVGWDPALSDS